MKSSARPGSQPEGFLKGLGMERQRGSPSAGKARLPNDYRYFPAPDIPIVVTEELLESTPERRPELPWAKEQRFAGGYGLPGAGRRLPWRSLPALYFEGMHPSSAAPLRTANWIRTEVFRVMNEKGLSWTLSSETLRPGGTRRLVEGGKLSTTVAGKSSPILRKGSPSGCPPGGRGLSPGLSAEDVEKMVDRVLLANGDVVEEIPLGRDPRGRKSSSSRALS